MLLMMMMMIMMTANEVDAWLFMHPCSRDPFLSLPQPGRPDVRYLDAEGVFDVAVFHVGSNPGPHSCSEALKTSPEDEP